MAETRTDRPGTGASAPSTVTRSTFAAIWSSNTPSTRETVERLRSVIDAQGLPAPDETIERQRFGQGGRLFSWDPAFCDLLDHPLAIAVLEELIGPYVRLDHAYGIAMRPGTSGLGLHGPAEPFDASQYYVYRMGAMRNGLLSLSWSLSDGVAWRRRLRLHPGQPPGLDSAAAGRGVAGGRGSAIAGFATGVHRGPHALHDPVAGCVHQARPALQVLARKHRVGSFAGRPAGRGGVDVGATTPLLPAPIGRRAGPDVRVLNVGAPVSMASRPGLWWAACEPLASAP